MNRYIGFINSKEFPDLRQYGVECETSPEGTKVFLNSEGQVFFDAYRMVALDDEDGSLDHSLRVFDNRVNPSGQTWELNTEGILNASQFFFTLTQKSGNKVRLKAGESKDLEFAGLSAGLIFVLNLITSNSSPLEVISLVKAIVGKFQFFQESVTLSPYLKSIQVSELGTITPEVLDQGQGYASVELKYTVLDEQGFEAGQGDLRNSNIIEGTNVIKVGQSSYLRLNPDETEIVKHLKKNEYRNVRASKLPVDATSLIPEGLDSERFNLSEYNPRVVGFAPAPKPSELGPSSGIEWYRNDDDSSFMVSFVADSKGPVKIKFDSIESISKDLEKVQDMLKSSNQSGEPQSVTLSSGQVVPLTKETLNALKETFTKLYREGAKVSDETVKKNKAIAAIIQELKGAAKPPRAIDANHFWSKVKSSLREGIQLKPHQIAGVEFLFQHYTKNEGGAFIADDMGLGKTLQTLAFLAGIRDQRRGKPILVVAPVILLKNWANEIEKFLKDEAFSVFQLHGDGLAQVRNGQGIEITKLASKDVILTNYKTLASWQTSLLKLDLSVAIFDESQNIKNPNTSTASAARGVKSEFVICLTGTPVENRLLDLWPQVSALQRQVHPLGVDLKEFTRSFEKAEHGVEQVKKALGYPGPNSIVIRREKSEVISLKPLRVLTEFIPMSPEQVQDEENIVKLYRNKPLGILQNLQKIYQHPALLKKSGHNGVSSRELIQTSPKLKWLLQKLRSIQEQGEKVLVFTLWRDMQDLIAQVVAEELDSAARIINGETNARDTESADRIIKSFTKSDGFDLIVASPIAAGAGLNITAATHVIHYGRWWNPAKEDQATCRAYRIGQELEVSVHYPILHHPEGQDRGFDVKLHQLVEYKRKLATDFLNPAITEFSAADAKAIFGDTK